MTARLVRIFACLALLAWAATASAQSLGPAERQTLRDIARDSIAKGLTGSRYTLPENLPPALLEKRGAFVTLTRQGKLRGCVGFVVTDFSLAATVALAARQAAFRDARFPPLEPDEMNGLAMEIAVLDPPRVLADPTSLEVGRDGLIIEQGWREGVLLPQVAVAQGWNREQFLDETCRKAGLDAGCWKSPDTVVKAFAAETF